MRLGTPIPPPLVRVPVRSLAAFEVVCPTCKAGVGRVCRAIRPSGHVHTASFGGLDYGHPVRASPSFARNLKKQRRLA